MSGPHTPTVAAAATAFLASYARAMALAEPSMPTSKNTLLVARALGAHYGPHCTAYALGHRISFPSAAAWTPGIEAHLQRFDACGLGCDISLARQRVEAVSDGSALCWATWRIRPRNGKEGWEWENVYAYRRAAAGGVAGAEEGAGKGDVIGEGEGVEGWEKPEGWWEFIVSDNEISALLARVPDFMER